MATPKSVSQTTQGHGVDKSEVRKTNSSLMNIMSPSAQETIKASVAAVIRSEVDTFLEGLFKKLEHVVSNKTPPRKAAIELCLCQTVESAVRRRRNDRVPFNQLPIDVIHCVFAQLLDLDRIYEATLPIIDIDVHRRNLFRLRCVSTAWNDFLVSSPRYWPAVDIGSHKRVIKRTIMRAQDTPLILYTGGELGWAKAPLVKRILKKKYASQISAIRVDGSGDEYFFWDLLKKGMSLLETLEVPSELWPGGDGEPSRQLVTIELPRLRNLAAERWEPPADAPWQADLQTLGIIDRWGFGANTLRVLSTCVNLHELELGGRGRGPRRPEHDYSEAPAQITLPKLQKLTLQLKPDRFLGEIVRRLIIPPEIPGLIRIYDLLPPLSEDHDRLVKDLGQFIFPGAGNQGVGEETIVQIDWWYPLTGDAWFTYKAGCRRIGLSQAQTGVKQDQIIDIITNLQGALNNPSLTVVVIDHKGHDTFLHKLADLGVEKIRIKGRKTDLDSALASIGSRKFNLPTGTITDTDWPFESLKELVVEDITLSIRQLIRIVGMRQPYLRSTSKTWLERISLVNCKFTGITVGQAVNQFAKLGVALVGTGCERAPRRKQWKKNQS